MEKQKKHLEIQLKTGGFTSMSYPELGQLKKSYET